MEKIKRELSNSVADFDIIQLKDKISKAETVEAVRDVVERTRGAELLRTMENARILSEVLKLSKQSDNPMMTTHRAKTHAVLCNSMVPARRKRGVRYTCCLCRNNFLGKKQLLLHNQKVHSNGVRFICVDHEIHLS